MVRFIFVLWLLFDACCALSQPKLNLTLFGGFSNYTGELQQKRFTIKQAHAAFGAGVSLQLKPKWYLNGTLIKGKVSGDDKLSASPANRARNLNFYSNIYEAALTVSYDLFDIDFSRWTPYASAGAAIFRFNPHGDGYRELRRFSTEGQGFVPGRDPYRIITISAPLAAGVRFRVAPTVLLGYEIGIRKTFTDYIDDVSQTYVDEGLLRLNRGQDAVAVAFRGDELDRNLPYPAAGTLRGSPKTKDWYYFSGITLNIAITNEDGKLFGKNLHKGSIECPKW
jgi:hypothetical protein